MIRLSVSGTLLCLSLSPLFHKGSITCIAQEKRKVKFIAPLKDYEEAARLGDSGAADKVKELKEKAGSGKKRR